MTEPGSVIEVVWGLNSLSTSTVTHVQPPFIRARLLNNDTSRHSWVFKAVYCRCGYWWVRRAWWRSHEARGKNGSRWESFNFFGFYAAIPIFYTGPAKSRPVLAKSWPPFLLQNNLPIILQHNLSARNYIIFRKASTIFLPILGYYCVEWGLIQVHVVRSYFQVIMLSISKGGFNHHLYTSWPD